MTSGGVTSDTVARRRGRQLLWGVPSAARLFGARSGYVASIRRQLILLRGWKIQCVMIFRPPVSSAMSGDSAEVCASVVVTVNCTR